MLEYVSKESVFAMKDFWMKYWCYELKDCSKRIVYHGSLLGSDVICDKGWSGITCNIKDCPKNCNDRGACIGGICICNQGFLIIYELGFSGETCDFFNCLNDCSGNGDCVNGKWMIKSRKM